MSRAGFNGKTLPGIALHRKYTAPAHRSAQPPGEEFLWSRQGLPGNAAAGGFVLVGWPHATENEDTSQKHARSPSARPPQPPGRCGPDRADLRRCHRALVGLGRCAAAPEGGPVGAEPYVSPYDWTLLQRDGDRLAYVENGEAALRRWAWTVSEHQGAIDWQAAAADGIGFAFVRVGNRGYTEGALYADARYAENLDGASAAGLEVGAYFFSQAQTSRRRARRRISWWSFWRDAAWSCRWCSTTNPSRTRTAARTAWTGRRSPPAPQHSASALKPQATKPWSTATKAIWRATTARRSASGPCVRRVRRYRAQRAVRLRLLAVHEHRPRGRHPQPPWTSTCAFPSCRRCRRRNVPHPTQADAAPASATGEPLVRLCPKQAHPFARTPPKRTRPS